MKNRPLINPSPLNRDYGKWLDIQFFRNAISQVFEGRIAPNTIRILANVFALTHAMQMRDFESGKATYPAPKEDMMNDFLKNLAKYLDSNNSSSGDWMELFVAGFENNKDQKQGKNPDLDLINKVSSQFNDDEYAQMAALEYIRASTIEHNKQAALVTRFLKIQQTLAHRSKFTEKLVIRRSWLDRLFGFFSRTSTKGDKKLLAWRRGSTKRRFFIFPAIFAGCGAALSSFMSGASLTDSARMGFDTALGKSFESKDKEQVVAKQDIIKQHNIHQNKVLDDLDRAFAQEKTSQESIKIESPGARGQRLSIHEQDPDQTLPFDSLLGDAIEASLKAASDIASASASALLAPSNTPTKSATQRVLETTGNGGSGGGGRGV